LFAVHFLPNSLGYLSAVCITFQLLKHETRWSFLNLDK
jgi:hypothetical protein